MFRLGAAAALAAMTFGIAASSGSAGDLGAGGRARSHVNPITIGILDSFTGASAPTCQPEQPGEALALAEAGHLKETVNGKRVPYLRGVAIKLKAEDDQSIAAPAVLAFRTLQDAGAVAIVGPCSSVGGSAVKPLLDAAKIPLVYTTAGAPDLVEPAYAFRGGSPFAYFHVREAQVMKGKGVKNVYALYSGDNPTLASTWTAMQASMKVLGINVVGSFQVVNSTVDYNPAIQQIQKTNPDALLILVRTSQALTAINQIRNSGLSQQLYGGAQFYTTQFLTAGALVKGSILATNFAAQFTYPSSVRFTKQYEAKYNVTPSNQSANGYDAMWRVLRAIHDVGPAKIASAPVSEARVLIQAALAKQKSANGAQGPLEFTADGDAKGRAGVVQIVDDQGTVKLLPIPSVASLLGKKK
jgi:ABC-type branched-subunit amino acid transport system substrate-binding protein